MLHGHYGRSWLDLLLRGEHDEWVAEADHYEEGEENHYDDDGVFGVGFSAPEGEDGETVLY